VASSSLDSALDPGRERKCERVKALHYLILRHAASSEGACALAAEDDGGDAAKAPDRSEELLEQRMRFFHAPSRRRRSVVTATRETSIIVESVTAQISAGWTQCHAFARILPRILAFEHGDEITCILKISEPSL